MACDCKKAKKFEEEYGTPQEESFLMKVNRQLFKVFFFLIAIGLTMIVTPYILCYSIYAMFWGNNKITLPKFLRKYLE